MRISNSSKWKGIKMRKAQFVEQGTISPWYIIGLVPTGSQNRHPPGEGPPTRKWDIPRPLWRTASREHIRDGSRPRGHLRVRGILTRKELCIQSRLRKLTDLKCSTRPHHIGGMWAAHTQATLPCFQYKPVSMPGNILDIRSARFRCSSCDASSWRWFCLLGKQRIRPGRSRAPGFWFPPSPWVLGMSLGLMTAARARFSCFGINGIRIAERECFWVKSSDCW